MVGKVEMERQQREDGGGGMKAAADGRTEVIELWLRNGS